MTKTQNEAEDSEWDLKFHDMKLSLMTQVLK